MEETKAKIRGFISSHLKNADFDSDDDLFAMGLVNSLFAMQLVLFVEREFNTTVENDDLEISNFSSVNAIANFVDSKLAAHVSA